MEKVSNFDWDEVKNRHVQDYLQLYNRTRFELNDTSSDNADIPTNQRLQKVIDGGIDPILSQLYFNFGKYLLIASSRPGDLAANLQGIWSDAIWDEEHQTWNYYTPWNGDYHTNINVQMNYWPAEVLNLPECAEPFKRFDQWHGETRDPHCKVQHDCRGWTVHTLHNIWVPRPLAAGPHGSFPNGGTLDDQPPLGALPIYTG